MVNNSNNGSKLLQNPVMLLALGLCTTVAISTTVSNALAIGLSTAIVLVLSSVIVSMLKKVLHKSRVQLFVHIVVVATLVSIVQSVMASYLPKVYENLGIFIALIAVSCLLMGRLDSYASQNTVSTTLFSSVVMGVVFVVLNVVLGATMQFLTSIQFDIFATVAGGFMVLAIVTALANVLMVFVVNRFANKVGVQDAVSLALDTSLEVPNALIDFETIID